jgi:thioredoxin-dependent peroxiredoxin
MLPIGTLAPRFHAKDSKEKTLRLEDFLGKTRIVLFFYPGDFTQYCTKQACIIRDNLESFRVLNALAFGISPDTSVRHRDFAEKHGLNYPLLSDPGKKIADLYKVPMANIDWLRRSTFIIDLEGFIIGRVAGQFRHRIHIVRALECLKTHKRR